MKLSDLSKQNKQNKNKIFKGEKTMKNTKLKVLVITLAVCLLAMGSLGTLAWFTASDEVTNNFLIADSEDDADEIFSINVWEKDDEGNVYDDEGITYPDIQPDDDLYKEVNIENTGYYDQYVRATVTITGADVWYDVFDEVFFGLENFATDLSTDFTVDRIEFNADENTIAYTLYYNNILASGDVVNLFTNININEQLDRFQAAALSGEFDIKVFAEAVQTANVPGPAKEAFAYVGNEKESGEFLVVTTQAGAERVAKMMGKAGTGLTINNTDDVSFDFSVTKETLSVNYVTVSGKLEVIDGAAAVGTPTDYGFIANGANAGIVVNGTEIKSAGGGIGATGGAKVIFNDGSLYVDSASTSGRYCFYAAGAGTEITINGGEFSWDPKDNQQRAYVYASAGTTVTINGGTFGKASTRSGYTAGILGDGTVIITGGTFGFNPSAWVADGFAAVEENGTWTVVAE